MITKTFPSAFGGISFSNISCSLSSRDLHQSRKNSPASTSRAMVARNPSRTFSCGVRGCRYVLIGCFFFLLLASAQFLLEEHLLAVAVLVPAAAQARREGQQRRRRYQDHHYEQAVFIASNSRCRYVRFSRRRQKWLKLSFSAS